jgi:uncharacterized protein
MTTQEIDREFIEYVVKQMVDEPENVEVTRSVDELGVLITLKVSKNDMGKVIGKSGQTAKALRILLRVIGSKNNARVNLKIIEPDGSEVVMGHEGGPRPQAAPTPTMEEAAPAPMTEEAPVVAEEVAAVAAPVLEEDTAEQHSTLPDDLDLTI